MTTKTSALAQVLSPHRNDETARLGERERRSVPARIREPLGHVSCGRDRDVHDDARCLDCEHQFAVNRSNIWYAHWWRDRMGHHRLPCNHCCDVADVRAPVGYGWP